MSRLLLVLLIVAGSAAGSAAQEVEFYAHRGSSDLDHLASADGLGFAGRFPLLEWLDVRVSLSLRSGTSGAVEEVCTQWQPRWQCYQEPVAYESSLQEAGVMLLPSLIETDQIRIAAGGGMTLNRLSSRGKGDSGRAVAVNMPGGAQRGFVGVADVSISPGWRSAWALVAGVKIHHTELDGCIADGDLPVVERFCGFYTFKEVRVGLAFRF